MPDIDVFMNHRAEVKVEYHGHTITIGYDAEHYEQSLAKRLAKIQETNDLDAVVDILERLLLDWDLTAGGEPLPITTETLAARSMPMLMAINVAIQTDMFASPNGPSSLRGSSTAPVSLPTTTNSSGQPGSLAARRPRGT